MRARFLRTAAALGAAAALMAGCSAAPPAVSPDVSSRLAAAAQQLRQDAASGHYAEALSQLDSLEREARTASGNAKISAERSSQVLDAIAAVRKDLESLESSSRPSPTAVPTPGAEPSQDAPATSSPTPEPTKGKGKPKKTQGPAQSSGN